VEVLSLSEPKKAKLSNSVLNGRARPGPAGKPVGSSTKLSNSSIARRQPFHLIGRYRRMKMSVKNMRLQMPLTRATNQALRNDDSRLTQSLEQPSILHRLSKQYRGADRATLETILASGNPLWPGSVGMTSAPY
jgi:hypothetical protein